MGTEGGDDGGFGYADQEVSGLIEIRKAFGREVCAVSEKKLEDDLMVERYLERAKLYGVRMEIRNALRKWYEKVPAFAKWLDVPYMEKMTAQQICDEESYITERRMKRAAFGKDGMSEEPLMISNEAGNMKKDTGTLVREEYAKRVVQKFEWQVQNHGYAAAVNYVKGELVEKENEDEKLEIAELVRLKAAEMISELIREKKADEAADAFFKLGAMALFSRADFFDVSEEELKDPEMKGAMLRKLAGFVKVDPELLAYATVKNHLAMAGFVDDEADSSPEIGKAAEELMKIGLDESAITYSKVLDTVHGGGLTYDMEEEVDRCQAVLVPRLLEKMKQSPALYAEVRKRWMTLGLIDEEDTADNAEFERVFSDHLQKMFAIHPFVYNKMKYCWSKLGLKENKHDETMHAMSANWLVRPVFAEVDVEGDKIMGFYGAEVAREQRLVEEEDAAENMSVRRLKTYYDANRARFRKEYPQYDYMIRESFKRVLLTGIM